MAVRSEAKYAENEDDLPLCCLGSIQGQANSLIFNVIKSWCSWFHLDGQCVIKEYNASGYTVYLLVNTLVLGLI